MEEIAPEPPEKRPNLIQRFSGTVGAWVADLSHRTFILTVVSGVLSALAAWMVQGYFVERDSRNLAASVVETIEVSVRAECNRLSDVFATLYDSYPTLTCDMNVYRLPQPDISLVGYLNDRRETIVAAMGEDGVKLIRSGALSSEGYNRIFSAHYFQSSISTGTATFQDYFLPMQEMCSIVDVPISIQECPFY